jgi:hypothetical protein
MKLKYIATIIIIFFLLSFKNSMITVNISGQLKPKKSETNIIGLKILIKSNNKIIAKTYTDSFGKFKFKLIPKDEKEFDFFCSGIGSDTLFLKRITHFENDSISLKISIPIKYKRKFLGKTICPICKRSDSVFKIKYLNLNPVIITNAEIIKTHKGELLKLPKREKYKQEKYIPTEISKYTCVRDNINF